MSFEKIKVPCCGEKITADADGKLNVPNNPIIAYIEGDGIGEDITKASMAIWNAAVEKAYGGERKIAWMEIFAGEKAVATYGENVWLPDETVEAIREYLIAIKGPLTTPVGGGIRSLNVALRQMLDLYVCLRPVQYFQGVPFSGQNRRKKPIWSSSGKTPKISMPVSNGPPELRKRRKSSNSSRRKWASIRSVSRKPAVSASNRFPRKELNVWFAPPLSTRWKTTVAI